MREAVCLGQGASYHLSDASLIFGPFLPRDASAERGDATVSRLSVCL